MRRPNIQADMMVVCSSRGKECTGVAPRGDIEAKPEVIEPVPGSSCSFRRTCRDSCAPSLASLEDAWITRARRGRGFRPR